MKVIIIGGCGYIGSAVVPHLKQRGFNVDTLDLELFGNPVNPENIKQDYRKIEQHFLQQYSHIIVLAAHSSVPMSQASPRAALENNVVGFFSLLEKVGPEQKVIYASSSSVYSGTGARSVDEHWSEFHPDNIYDLTKYAADAIATFSKKYFFGLRLGTVCGAASNLRTELILNSMTLSAIENGFLTVRNPNVHRPILGIQDLCRALEAILRNSNTHPGFYNLASFNTTVYDAAVTIAQLTGAKIHLDSDTHTYDFSINTKKFQDVFGFSFKETTESIVKSLLDQHRTTGMKARKSYGTLL